MLSLIKDVMSKATAVLRGVSSSCSIVVLLVKIKSLLLLGEKSVVSLCYILNTCYNFVLAVRQLNIYI